MTAAAPARVPGWCPACLEPVHPGDPVTTDGTHVTCLGGPPRLVTTLAAPGR